MGDVIMNARLRLPLLLVASACAASTPSAVASGAGGSVCAEPIPCTQMSDCVAFDACCAEFYSAICVGDLQAGNTNCACDAYMPPLDGGTEG
jgi:hypothetical protein